MVQKVEAGVAIRECKPFRYMSFRCFVVMDGSILEKR